MRRLAKHEELVFQRRVYVIAHAGGALYRPVQQAARTDGARFTFEFRQEQQHVFAARTLFQRQPAAALRHDPELGVGVGGVPAGVLGVVVELVVEVPAEHDVAECQSRAQGPEKLVATQILAQHDAVHVGQAYLDMRERAGLHQTLRVFHRCYP
ncbi:hypothetical protein D3C72_1453030 [compost metagenome]